MEEYKVNNFLYRLKRKLIIVVLYIVLGVISFLLFSHYLQYKRILTPLKSNEVTYSVKLSDGYLYFNNQKWISQSDYSFDETKQYIKNYTIDKYIDYIDKDPRLTKIPENLKDTTVDTQSLYYDLNNNIVNDNFKYSYSNNDNTKSITINVSRNKLPLFAPLSNEKDISASNMRSTEMKISYYKDENWIIHYLAEFIYDNVGYTIDSYNLTQQEFIDVMYSIID